MCWVFELFVNKKCLKKGIVETNSPVFHLLINCEHHLTFLETWAAAKSIEMEIRFQETTK